MSCCHRYKLFLFGGKFSVFLVHNSWRADDRFCSNDTNGKFRLWTVAHWFQCLEENQRLLNAIVENQNLGRLEDCVKFMQILQKNLIFLSTMGEKQMNYQN